MSGQQISAFALQIGNLPSHPSSAAAAAAHFHPCPPVPTVAKERLVSVRLYLHVSERQEKNEMCSLECMNLSCTFVHAQNIKNVSVSLHKVIVRIQTVSVSVSVCVCVLVCVSI